MAFSLIASAMEYVAMMLFVIVGCGSAMAVAGTAAWVLQVSLTFGLAITALAYSVGHYSGGHINCAVTFGLLLTGQCELTQAAGNLLAQILGSLTGAGVLCAVFPEGKDLTGSIGANGVSNGFSQFNALAGEIAMTFLLVFVVLQTACNPKSADNRAQACIAIGFAVFLAHTVLIPVDGCSINPTRSLGPAVIAKIRHGSDVDTFKDMWVFWVGPFLGSALAVGAYKLSNLVSQRESGRQPELKIEV